MEHDGRWWLIVRRRGIAFVIGLVVIPSFGYLVLLARDGVVLSFAALHAQLFYMAWSLSHPTSITIDADGDEALNHYRRAPRSDDRFLRVIDDPSFDWGVRKLLRLRCADIGHVFVSRHDSPGSVRYNVCVRLQDGRGVKLLDVASSADEALAIAQELGRRLGVATWTIARQTQRRARNSTLGTTVRSRSTSR